MRVAVVDDGDHDRKVLTNFIKRFFSERNFNVQLSSYECGELFLRNEDLTLLDLVFLDIYMEAKSGMDVARILRKQGYNGFIVFCTTTGSYALEGYSVKAYDYIIKPYTYKMIEKLLHEISIMHQEERPSIRIKAGRAWHRIELHDILYLENSGNYISVYTKDKLYSTRMTFKEMENKLGEYDFFIRCDRGIMVNLFNIYQIRENLIIMSDQSKIPISRRNLSRVNKQYLEFIFDEMERT